MPGVVRMIICGECISSIDAALTIGLPFHEPSPSWNRSHLAMSFAVETIPDAGATVVKRKCRIGCCTPSRIACGDAAFTPLNSSSELLEVMPSGSRRRSRTREDHVLFATASAIAPETEYMMFE